MDRKRGVAIVMRKDGTVPFDDDVPEDHRAIIMGALVANGHEIHLNQETGVLTVKSGPMIDARDAAVQS